MTPARRPPRVFSPRRAARLLLALFLGTASASAVGCQLLAGLGDPPSVSSPTVDAEPDTRPGTADASDTGTSQDGPLLDARAGDATRTDGSADADPIPPPSGGQIATGETWGCALRAGTLYCWGTMSIDSFGLLHRLDGGALRHPGLVRGEGGKAFEGVAEVRSGVFHSCARKGDKAYCWGYDANGRLGSSGGPSGVPVNATLALSDILELAAGGSFSCARRSEDVRCWGGGAEKAFSQLARPDASELTSASPVVVPGLAGVRHIAVGNEHACAVKADATVVCWGRNDLAQAGPPTNEKCGGGACITTPRAIPNLRRVRQLALSGSHSCALDADGKVWCWGGNQYDELGRVSPQLCAPADEADASRGCSDTPTAVFDHAVHVAAGMGVTCAVKGSGEVWCWGSNGFGQLGQGAPRNGNSTIVPTQVTRASDQEPLTGMSEVAFSRQGWFGCATGADAGTFCWGTGALGSDAGDFARATSIGW